jgi:hypothetical protein
MSNGSERTPESWAGLRAEVARLTAENERLRAAGLDQAQAFLEGITRRELDRQRIRDIEAERDALRASFQQAEEIHEGVVRRLAAKRDALQAQLDSMTVEWARGPSGDRFPTEMNSEVKARYYAAECGESVYRRLVGPWVEVKGEEA